MHTAVIAATGLYTPPQAVSNAELVEAFNAYVERHNARHAEEIAAGAVEALAPSSPEFIVRRRAGSRAATSSTRRACSTPR